MRLINFPPSLSHLLIIFLSVLTKVCTQSSANVESLALKCKYETSVLNGISYYTCYAIGLENHRQDTEVSNVNGEHVSGHSNDDVKALIVKNQNVTFLPNKIGEIFGNLVRFEVTNSPLIGVQKSNFEGMNLETLKVRKSDLRKIEKNSFEGQIELREIYLDYNKIEELDGEIFSTNSQLEVLALDGNKLKNLDESLLANLPNLKQLYLQSNEIEKLTEDLFQNNENLEILHAENNKLKVIEPMITENLKNLKKIELSNNTCLEDFPEFNEIKFEKLEIYAKLDEYCIDYAKMRRKIQEYRNKYEEKNREFEELKKTFNKNTENLEKLLKEKEEKCLENLENEKKSLQDQIDLLKSEKNSLENENEILKSEKSLLEMENENLKREIEEKLQKIQECEEKSTEIPPESSTTSSESEGICRENLAEIQKSLISCQENIQKTVESSAILLNSCREKEEQILNLKSSLQVEADKSKACEENLKNASDIMSRKNQECKVLQRISHFYTICRKNLLKNSENYAKLERNYTSIQSEYNSLQHYHNDLEFTLTECKIQRDFYHTRFAECQNSPPLAYYDSDSSTCRKQLDYYRKCRFQCEYQMEDEFYTCKAVDVFVTHTDMEIDEVTGRKPENRVEKLEISSQVFKFPLKNILTNFPYLKILEVLHSKLTDPRFESDRLEVLKIHGNEIVQIPGNAFARVANIQVLSLINNKIQILRANSFNGLFRLKKLDLKENKISNLPSGIFIDLTSLTHLSMSSNALTTIDGQVLANLSQLEVVIFDNNRGLRRIGEQLLNYSRRLKQASFIGTCVGENGYRGIEEVKLRIKTKCNSF